VRRIYVDELGECLILEGGFWRRHGRRVKNVGNVVSKVVI